MPRSWCSFWKTTSVPVPPGEAVDHPARERGLGLGGCGVEFRGAWRPFATPPAVICSNVARQPFEAVTHWQTSAAIASPSRSGSVATITRRRQAAPRLTWWRRRVLWTAIGEPI
jgi:hypothetical protein